MSVCITAASDRRCGQLRRGPLLPPVCRPAESRGGAAAGARLPCEAALAPSRVRNNGPLVLPPLVAPPACAGSARAVLNRFSTLGEAVALQRSGSGLATDWWSSAGPPDWRRRGAAPGPCNATPAR